MVFNSVVEWNTQKNIAYLEYAVEQPQTTRSDQSHISNLKCFQCAN